MKSLLTTFLIIISLSAFSITSEYRTYKTISQHNPIYQSAVDSTDQTAVIRNAVEQYYIKGLKIRDFSLIRAICINDTKLYGVRKDGSLNETTLDEWSKRFDPDNPPFSSLEYNIEKIDYEGTAAQVKIYFLVNKKKVVHDFLNLLNIDGTWKIVNIIDH